MFRLESNTPAYYTEESRDFQLLCRLYNLCINDLIFGASKITDILDPLECDERLLPLVAKYVGFFTKLDIPTRTLRYILSAFPSLIKDKGTSNAVYGAVIAILKSENYVGDTRIITTHRVIDDTWPYSGKYLDSKSYILSIETPIPLSADNERALREVLKYILPAGFIVNIEAYSPASPEIGTKIISKFDIHYVNTGVILTSRLRQNKDGDFTGDKADYINSVMNGYNTTELVTEDLYKDEDAYKGPLVDSAIKENKKDGD